MPARPTSRLTGPRVRDGFHILPSAPSARASAAPAGSRLGGHAGRGDQRPQRPERRRREARRPRRKETRMSHDGASNGLSRRDLIKTGALAAGAAAVLPARPAAAQLKTVARNRTLSLVWIGSREGRWVDFELWNPYAHRGEPPERPGHPLRAAGLLQRLRRQGAPLAGRELPVQPGLQGADDQDPLRHHVERRRAVLRRGRRLHARPASGTWARRCAGASTSSSSCRRRGRPTPTRS